MRYSPRQTRGAAMITVLVITLVLVGLSMAALSTSTAESRHSQLMLRQLRARYVAEGGTEQTVAFLKDATSKASLDDPFGWLDALDATTLYTAQQLTQDGYVAGSFTVSLAVSGPTNEGGAGGPVTTAPQTDGSGFTSTITATDNGDGTTTLTATLTSSGAPGSKALSHVTFGLPASAQASASATATSPGNYPTEWVDPDPTTGVTGLKFDETTLGEDQVVESETFNWTVPTGEVTTVTVATKAGPGVASLSHNLGGGGGNANTTELYRLVAITSVAWSPAEGTPGAVRAEVTSTVKMSLERARIFDYSYFVHNWGWFYGNTIVANGNVRANGQFDGGNYSSTINGVPRYSKSDGPNLSGYVDDGGIFSGWDVVQAGNVLGMGGETDNQYPFYEPLPMPNLSDLTSYENIAKGGGSTIKVGGLTIVSGVLGDDAGEPQHLYLEGTALNPIVINGPVVIRGSVIIKGVVTGQGAIYAGGNVYIPDNLTYANPPATPRPTSSSLADRIAWRTASQDKDALGLFARENIVLGDFTDGTADYYMSSWLSNPLNVSIEDTGDDQIANTNDVNEGDGQWSTQIYSAGDVTFGLVPVGKNVGDPIPGTGEDTDGDGIYDPTSTTADFALPAALDSGQWAGNMPPGTTSFNQVATIYVNKFEAALYTNHTLGGLMLNWGGDVTFNGTVVSRNESLIYGANRLVLNHDDRLTAGGEDFGFYLPYVWGPIETLRYEVK